jgi:hypothetical protein
MRLALLVAVASASFAQPFASTTVLSPPGSDPGSRYGSRIVLDQDTLAVSAPSFEGGIVYVYERAPREPEAWSLAKRIVPPDGCDAWRVDLEGDTLVVGGCSGSCGTSSASRVYVYNRGRGGAGNWGIFQVIPADFPSRTWHAFGDAVAISGGLLAIGDPYNETVRTYERRPANEGGWVEISRLSRDETPYVGSFGSWLEVSGRSLAISAANHCVGPSDSDIHSEGVFNFERDPAAADGFRATRHLPGPRPTDSLYGERTVLEGPTLVLNGYDGLEIHERHHRGSYRWGQRQLLEWGRAFAVRGRTVLTASNTPEGAEILLRERFKRGGGPWVLTQQYVDTTAVEYPRISDAAVGPREAIVAYGRNSPRETPGRVVIYHRQPIHADDFESSDLGLWDQKKRKVKVTEPGLAGSAHALEVTADGKGKKSFVRTRKPEHEPLVTVDLLLNPNGVALGGQDVEILRLSGGGNKSVTVTLREHLGDYRLSLWARASSGPLTRVGELDIPVHEDVPLRLEWRRATGDGHDNGVALLSRVGRSPVGTRTLANERLTIDDIRLGLPSGAKGTEGGSFLIDDLELCQ